MGGCDGAEKRSEREGDEGFHQNRKGAAFDFAQRTALLIADAEALEVFELALEITECSGLCDVKMRALLVMCPAVVSGWPMGCRLAGMGRGDGNLPRKP
jgi:hypothetical protein